MPSEWVVEAEDRLGSGLVPKRPLELTRGQGSFLFDEAGNKYLDCMTGVGVACLGHAHPDWVEAVKAQVETLSTAYENTYLEARAKLYQSLSKRLPASLHRFFLCNSGTEAVEAALKFARIQTGRTDFLVFKQGYHGKTLGALSATAQPKYQKPVAPLVPGFHPLRFGDTEALVQAVEEHGPRLAGILVELIQGEGGIHDAPGDFVAELRAQADRSGAKLIFDEVQTGVGRTGAWFCFEHYGVVPDLLTLAKGLGGGMPIGLVAFSPKLELPSRVHSSTFGGNPLAAVAARVTLEVLERDQLIENCRRQGAYLRSQIESWDHPKIRRLKGRGLMLGVELKARAGRYLKPLQEAGVLALLASSTVLRFMPPLNLSRDEADLLLSALRDALDEA